MDADGVALGEQILREMLASFPFVQVTVTGGCMEPALREGEQVCLLPAKTKGPRLGDIVLVIRDSEWRLHRLVWGPPLAERKDWRTMADRALSLDPRSETEDIAAVALAHEGWLLRYWRTIHSLGRAGLSSIQSRF